MVETNFNVFQSFIFFRVYNISFVEFLLIAEFLKISKSKEDSQEWDYVSYK